MRRVKVFVVSWLCVLCMLISTTAYGGKNFSKQLYAQAAVLMDGRDRKSVV